MRACFIISVYLALPGVQTARDVLHHGFERRSAPLHQASGNRSNAEQFWMFPTFTVYHLETPDSSGVGLGTSRDHRYGSRSFHHEFHAQVARPTDLYV
jgi:hypothetical protein